MVKSGLKLFFSGLLLVLLLFGLIRIVYSSGGKMFILELFGLLVLLLLSIIGLGGYGKPWGERVVFFVFLLYLLNLVLIWLVTKELVVVLMVLALTGFILSVPFGSRHKKESGESLHSQVFEEPKQPPPQPKAVHSAQPKTVQSAVPMSLAPSKAEKPAAKFVPGKYVASKSSNTYHEPKCDWAKKIKEERRIWFASKEEAWEKGYKAHGCVQEK